MGVGPGDGQRLLHLVEAVSAGDQAVQLDPAGGWSPRVIGSIVEYLYAPDDPEAVIEKMADPATRIVSLTVARTDPHAVKPVVSPAA